MDKQKIQEAIRTIIKEIDPDPDRKDLARTPERVAKMYEEIFSGINKNPEEDLQVFFQEEGHEELILVKV